MDDLEGYELIVGSITASNEEERGITAVYDFGV
jgi:hypothetical protein